MQSKRDIFVPSPLCSLRPLTVALATVLISGCMVGPDFSRPQAPTLQHYSADPLQRTVAASDQTELAAGAAQQLDHVLPVSARWWQSFDSATLNQLVAEAFRANPDLAAAQAALREASENMQAAHGALIPSISGGLDSKRQHSSSSGSSSSNGGRVYNTFNASVDVSYELDVFGGNRRAYEALQASHEYQQFELEASYLSLASNVVNAAISEASYREQIATTKDIIQLQQQLLDILQTQFEFGSISQADVESQVASIAATQASLPPLQKSLALLRNQLAVYLGKAPSELSMDPITLDQLTLPQQLPLSLPSDLVAQRPDIRASAALMHQAAAEVGVATANQLPQFGITGSYGSEGNTFAELFSPGTLVWNLASSITQSIFDGGIKRHQTRASEAAYDQAQASYRSVVLSAFQDVANVLDALNYDAQTLRARVIAEEAATRSEKIADEQYKAGGTSYSTLLDAQKTLLNARLLRVQAQAARLTDTVALYQALGGGWWNRSGTPQAAAAALPVPASEPSATSQQ